MDTSLPANRQLQEQRRALLEETVSYAIYLSPTVTTNDSAPQLDQDQIQPNVTLESLQSARNLISTIVAQLTKDYIWHKDAFLLWIESTEEKLQSSQPYLKGETRVGDSQDDEWLIVFLLREITKTIPGSIARVQDNDGEFLLIEAADQIPSWLDPDNSDNRVFIYEGNLHIIPIPITTDERKTFPDTVGSRSKPPKLQDALRLVRSLNILSPSTSTFSTLASPKIQQAAFGPLLSNTSDADFSVRKRQEQRHYARCQIPVEIARILRARPELVTKACEAFYTRDALGMAACGRMTKFFRTESSGVAIISTAFPLSSTRLGKNSTPFVTTAVCFTKTCYAQLMGQQFRPPKIWDGIAPPAKAEDANDPMKVKEAELGMKLTCGFEILCSPDYPNDFGLRRGERLKAEDFPFATDVGWRNFKNNLTARKYFEDELPGSQQYKKLEETAKRQYLESKERQQDGVSCPEPTSFHGHGYHPVEEIDRVIGIELQPSETATLIDNRKDDDDSWMDVDLEILEEMMRSRGFGGAEGSGKRDETSASGGLDMQELLNRFGGFIQDGEGGVDGAEFLDELSDNEADDDDDDNDDEDSGDNSESDDIVEDRELPDNDDDDVFASDYEERQAKRQESKRSKTLGSGSAFIFDNQLDSETVVAETKTPQQGFAFDREQLRDVLTRTFGEDFLTSGAKNRLAGRKEEGEELYEKGEEMDDGDLKAYMEALDAELAGTKIGQSFEKMPAKSSATTATTATTQPKVDKGKGVSVPNAQENTEKTLEELVKEYTERSRRGFSRHGPLGGSGTTYGYDPAAMAFVGDGEDEDEDEENGVTSNARVTEIDINDDDREEEAVDLDLNLAKNLLESFKSQGGLPGPGGNILARLGIVLPKDEEHEDDD